MYVSLHFPFAPQYFPQKKHGFSSVFAKRTSKNIEFFQILGKRMQEAQASKKAGRGNRAWDPCFATPAPRRLRLVERHQIAARYVGDPPQKNLRNRRRAGGGGVILYPLVSIRHAEQCRTSSPFPFSGFRFFPFVRYIPAEGGSYISRVCTIRLWLKKLVPT